MTEWTIAQSTAATFIVLVVGSGFVAATTVVIVSCLEWVDARLTERRQAMMLATDPHEYHDAIKPRQEYDYSEWLERANAAITLLSKERDTGIVTSDDVWDICPPPDGVDARVMGALWRPRDRWVKVGYVTSRRAINHKRTIAQWRYLRLEDLRRAAE